MDNDAIGFLVGMQFEGIRADAEFQAERERLRRALAQAEIDRLSEEAQKDAAKACVGAVVGEYLGSAQGVGYLILQAEGTFDINTVMAGIVVLTGFALLLDAVVGQVQARLMKWQPRAGETEKL